jgi:Ser/Thr protein kinase RdoA (MazF antagonist)
MLKEVARAYSDVVLTQALVLHGLAKEELTSIDTNTDVVFEFDRDDRSYVLKLVHSSQATFEQVCGEVDWINYLAKHGLSVSQPVPSRSGNLAERVKAGSTHFTVMVYEKGRGVLVRYEDDEYNSVLYRRCGQFVGRMHALAKTYTPSSPGWRRPPWYELMTKEHFHVAPGIINHKKQSLIEHLHTLPRDRDGFGLTHGDFHAYNFLVNEDDITVFDFAECHYSWFAYEIATILYHVLDLPYEGPDYDRFGRFFIEHFMQAYKKENRLDTSWEKEMIGFLRLREILIYAYLDSNWDWRSNPGFVAWMEACRYRIENELPIANVDFDFG